MTGTGFHDTLDEDVWPASVHAVDGVLTIGGCDVRDLAAEYQTPLWVLDEAEFRSRCRAWREALGEFGHSGQVYYAAKAFLCLAVARWVADEGLGLDVCTGGELAVAVRAGFPVDRIIFHGNNKSRAELERAVEVGVGRVVLDSFEEIVRLAHAAEAAGRRQPVLIRVTPGVEAHTHEYVATGQEDQKFGFSLASGAAAEAVRRVLRLPSLELLGLHSHIGSQIFDTAGFRLAAHRLVALLREIKDEHGVDLAELDIGGGLGIAYTDGDLPLAAAEFVKTVQEDLERECASREVVVPTLAVEPGRAISGPTTVTLYEVGTVKELPGLRTYVSVDGGMSDNIRTALYGARYSPTLASRTSDAPTHNVTVCGKHCETGDIVAHDVALPADIAPGDLLALPSSGAYHRSLASNYNHVPRPAVVAVADGRSRVIVRRETEDDLLRLDVPEE